MPLLIFSILDTETNELVKMDETKIRSYQFLTMENPETGEELEDSVKLRKCEESDFTSEEY